MKALERDAREPMPSSTRRTQQRGFPQHHGVAHIRKGAAKIPVVQRHGPQQNSSSGDSDTSTVWHIPAEAITTVTLVSFRGATAAGQFIALASKPALASPTSERRFSLAVWLWLTMAAWKWWAVMARSVGWFFSALASFTQSRAARWQV